MIFRRYKKLILEIVEICLNKEAQHPQEIYLFGPYILENIPKKVRIYVVPTNQDPPDISGMLDLHSENLAF